MTRLVAAAAVMLTAAAARGDKTIVDRLVHFAAEGCDFLHSQIPPGSEPLPADATIAPHFGRVVAVSRTFDRDTFTLDVPQFRGWRVTMRKRWIEMHLPARTRLTVAELEQRLGAAKPPDVDVSIADDSASKVTAEPEELAFAATSDRPLCWIRVTAASGTQDHKRQHVLTFQFTD
ncbi:MAG: hypothetical protein JWM53_5405 [bacterium]|nr:hypothetical protein [bacterium]